MLTASRLFAAAALALAAGAAPAATIFDTGTPDPGFFGWIGYDVFVGQKVAVAFTPDQTYTLDDVGVWMMSNDWDNAGRTYTLSLQNDSGGADPTVPGGSIIESWSMATAAVGWNPVLDVATSILHPTLTAGTRYWIVATSTEEAFVDPVWVWGSSWDSILSANTTESISPAWQSGYTSGSAPGTLIHGTPSVPAPAAAALFGLAGLGATRRRR